MFEVTIKATRDLAGGSWEVRATTPGGAEDDNPFRDCNDDWPLGETLARAMDLAMAELLDPIYILAVALTHCRSCLSESLNHREETEAALMGAVEVYLEAVNPKEAVSWRGRRSPPTG